MSGVVTRAICQVGEKWNWVHKGFILSLFSGEKGKRLVREEIAGNFDVGEWAVSRAFSQMKKEELIISNGRKGLFVA